MKRLLVVSLVLVALIAVAVLWSDGGTTRAAPKPTNERRPQDSMPAVKQPTRSPPTTGKVEDVPEPQTHLPDPAEDYGELRRLRGRVVWEDGTPVEKTQVFLRSSPFDGFTRFALGLEGEVESESRTDENGAFEVDWVAGGLWELTVHYAFEFAVVVRTPPLEGELVVELPRRPTTLQVEVVREATDAPIANAVVYAYWLGSDLPKAEQTGTEGRTAFRGAFGGPVRLKVEPRDGERITDHFVECKAGETTRTRIPIGRGLTVKGTVVADDSGMPLQAAQVNLGFRLHPTLRGPETDGDGRFEWDSLPWERNVRRTLSVTAEGFAPWECQIGHPDKDGATQELAIRLLRPAIVRLRCVHPDRSPRANLLVIAETERLIPEARSIAADLEPGRTDAEGRVSFTKLAPGDSGKVTCWIRGAIAHEIPFAAIGPSEVRDLGEVVIRDPRALTGVVRTASGKPAAGAFVVLELHHAEDQKFAALSSALIAPRFGARVDSEGRFRIRGVQPGVWDLLVHGGGHPRLLRAAIPIPEAGVVQPLKLRLPQPVALKGRVVDRNGAGVPDLEVSYMRSHPVAANLVESVRTDSEGRFEIPGFTREDEDIPLYAGSAHRKVTPRDGPIEIRLE